MRFELGLKSPHLRHHWGSENTPSVSSGTAYNDASATGARGLFRASHLLAGIVWILGGQT